LDLSCHVGREGIWWQKWERLNISRVPGLHNKRELYMEYRKYKNPTLTRLYKDYCQILSKGIKEAKMMAYDRLIVNSTNRMKSSWNLINTE
jgi:hypothetical protein